MKIISLVGGLVAMSMTGVSVAGAMPWTGFYGGLNTAVDFSHATLSAQQLGFVSPNDACHQSEDYSALAPGMQLGYLQTLRADYVMGVEVNASINKYQKHAFDCNSQLNPEVGDHFQFRNQMQTAVKARFGQSKYWNGGVFLPYLTVGASFAQLGLSYTNEGGDDDANNVTRLGWLIGGGIEWAFTSHWSVRAEYFYTDYGNAIHLNLPTVYGLYDAHGGASMNLNASNLAVAVNYWA